MTCASEMVGLFAPLLLLCFSPFSTSQTFSSPSLGGAVGCVVTSNKLYSHGNLIRQLSRAEIGQIAKYRREINEFKIKIDEAFARADVLDDSSSATNSSIPPMPPRPAMPSFCSGKDTILYIFAGCTVQNNKVYIGKNFARELDAEERKKLAEFTQKIAANQAALQNPSIPATTYAPAELQKDLEFCMEF